jgi:hypothetical protein
MLYEHERFEAAGDDMDEEATNAEPGNSRRASRKRPTQMRGRPVMHGSFHPATLAFSPQETDYPLRVTLAPARTQCLCCGGTAGSRSVVTPVALGTSAAVKVMAEGLVEALADANRGREGHDGKERLLVFSDSRQDAAHQALWLPSEPSEHAPHSH